MKNSNQEFDKLLKQKLEGVDLNSPLLENQWPHINTRLKLIKRLAGKSGTAFKLFAAFSVILIGALTYLLLHHKKEDNAPLKKGMPLNDLLFKKINLDTSFATDAGENYENTNLSIPPVATLKSYNSGKQEKELSIAGEKLISVDVVSEHRNNSKSPSQVDSSIKIIQMKKPKPHSNDSLFIFW